MSEQLADHRGQPSTTLLKLYERWGTSGAGLLISGNVIVDPFGTSEPRQVVLDDRSDRALLQDWTRAATDAGAHFWAQLNHAGGQTPRFLHRRCFGPSPLPSRRALHPFAPVVPMSPEDIRRLVVRFGIAAEVAVETGFTGVQVHAAHGYLISQFLSAVTNTRTDRWGGSDEGRGRFLSEVFDEIRRRVGQDVPVGLKLSSSDFRHAGQGWGEAMQTLAALRSKTLDLVEISGGTFESPAMLGLSPQQERSSRDAYFLDFVEASADVRPCPVMLTGGFRSTGAMKRAIRTGVDVIGLARPMILNPSLPRSVLDGEVDTLPRATLNLQGPRLFRAVTEIGWHTREMERRAHGQAVSLPGRPWLVGLGYLIGQVRDALPSLPTRRGSA